MYVYLRCKVCIFLCQQKKKENWKCKDCSISSCSKNNKNSNVVQSTSTPLSTNLNTEVVNQTKELLQSTSTICGMKENKNTPCHEEITKSTLATDLHMPLSDNVTTRKYKINVDVSNSFEHLQEEESLETLPTIENCKLNRSCPEIKLNLSYEVKELKEAAGNLQARLDTAENQIDELISENFKLKKKIEDYERKVQILRNVCPSPASTSGKSIKKKRKSKSSPLSQLEKTIDYPQFTKEVCNSDVEHLESKDSIGNG